MRKYNLNKNLENISEYQPPKHLAPVDLRLDANEGRNIGLENFEDLISSIDFSQYPSKKELEQVIADYYHLNAKQVFISAGGDEAICRISRAILGPEKEIIFPVPSFEMISKFAEYTSAKVQEVLWQEENFPLEQVLSKVNNNTAAIAIVSPNNPNGFIIKKEQLIELSKKAPGVLLLIDLAYVEFSKEDLTRVALSLPDTIVFRTFSKAWGLAGLRVGYTLSSEEIISWLKKIGSPYSVSSLSMFIAKKYFLNKRSEMETYVSGVIKERVELEKILQENGVEVKKSQANFVLAKFKNAKWIWEALYSLGIAVRIFENNQLLENYLRITLPGDEKAFLRLKQAILAAISPQAILFDMDGVLAGVKESYRRAIILTAKNFGINVTFEDIAIMKEKGNANNDWILTKKLLAERGVEVELDKVIEVYQKFYLGSPSVPGLREQEFLLCPKEILEKLSSKYLLAIVTGRPRKEAEDFLQKFEIENLFSVLVCMEDAPLKPDPLPVEMALEKLAVKRAWMIGDTADDILAAKGAGVISLSLVASGEKDHSRNIKNLLSVGSARVLSNINELLEILV